MNAPRFPFEPCRRAASLSFALGLVAFAGSSAAHDVWLEPATYRPWAGETVGIEVHVGESFVGESLPRNPARIAGFWLESAVRGRQIERREVRGVAGVSPAGVVRIAPDADGWHAVRYVSLPATIELSAERFVRHLRAEGLARLAVGLEAAGSPSGLVREVYSRCVATLLRVRAAQSAPPAALGSAGEVLFDRAPDACELALWPVRAPHGDRTLELRLTLRGRPVAGVPVRAYLRSSPPSEEAASEGSAFDGEAALRPATLERRTDSEGRVVLPLRDAGAVEGNSEGDGVWLVKALHVEAPTEPGAPWRSFWATLTFELPGR